VLQVLNEPLCIFNLIEVFKDRFFPFSIIESAKWESESESESGSYSESESGSDSESGAKCDDRC
jgi:hypothetical protein